MAAGAVRSAESWPPPPSRSTFPKEKRKWGRMENRALREYVRARAEDQMKAGDEEGCKATAGEAIKALSGE